MLPIYDIHLCFICFQYTYTLTRLLEINLLYDVAVIQWILLPRENSETAHNEKISHLCLFLLSFFFYIYFNKINDKLI